MRSIGNSLKSGRAAGQTGVFVVVFTPLSPVLSRRFYMYKLPVRRGKQFSGEGEKYLLLEKGSEGWTDGKGSVNESTGALGRTVGQLYSHNKVRCLDTVSDPSHHHVSHFPWSFWAQLLFDATNKLPYSSNKIRK